MVATPTLPDGWIAFEAKGPLIKSKALTGSLYQRGTPTKVCHLGQLSADGASVSTPHHVKGPRSYPVAVVTLIDIGAWRGMGACAECQRLYAELPT